MPPGFVRTQEDEPRKPGVFLGLNEPRRMPGFVLLGSNEPKSKKLGKMRNWELGNGKNGGEEFQDLQEVMRDKIEEYTQEIKKAGRIGCFVKQAKVGGIAPLPTTTRKPSFTDHISPSSNLMLVGDCPVNGNPDATQR
ncbi:hypothetical protein SLEP1_g43967 [Rubroshorea leprosula]|uniref:Uncharacterized protein n=1 Tax=Rubroshorea leprosula TaxID=152421 RepID=A0AAV5LF27_9ROSI|nr:hypothetical protein SLEP1_g43967 [Rubroshorea leprosula]